MDQYVRFALSALLAAASPSVAGAAHAGVTVTGDVSPGNPSDPWDLGSSTLLVGGASDPWEPTFGQGEVIVAGGGELITAAASIGDSRRGAVQVVGYGSTWTNHGSIDLCVGGMAEALLAVQNGAVPACPHSASPTLN
ncbi:hypothetical protein WMF27_33595 [Sorangium sp. So ce281]|uniref:hypothetical protein n=1 Tax=unclassified Sorangium TaxID=2621164 RepID=UPI003F61F02C